MAGGYFPKGSSNSRYGAQIQAGIKQAQENGQMIMKAHDNYMQEKKDYADALYKKQEFEMKQEKFKHDKSTQLLKDFSEQFPEGDEKAQQRLANFKQFQPEVYKELINNIKEGRPSAIDPESGDIIPIPQYKMQSDALKYEQNRLEQRVAAGVAEEPEVEQYIKSKSLTAIHDKAVSLASTKNGGKDWDLANDSQKTQMVANESRALFQSLVQQYMSKQQGTAEALGNPDQQQENQQLIQTHAHAPQINPILGSLLKLAANVTTRNVPQGQVPVASNQQTDFRKIWR